MKNEKSKNDKDKNFTNDLVAGLLVGHDAGSKILLKQGFAKDSMTSSILVTENHCKDKKKAMTVLLE